MLGEQPGQQLQCLGKARMPLAVGQMTQGDGLHQAMDSCGVVHVAD